MFWKISFVDVTLVRINMPWYLSGHNWPDQLYIYIYEDFAFIDVPSLVKKKKKGRSCAMAKIRQRCALKDANGENSRQSAYSFLFGLSQQIICRLEILLWTIFISWSFVVTTLTNCFLGSYQIVLSLSSLLLLLLLKK